MARRPRIAFHRLEDDGVARAWDELAEATAAGPFARPGWFRAWAEAFGRTVDVAVADGASALLPVERRGSGALESPTNEQSPELTSVAASDEARRALFEGLLSENRASCHFMKVAGADLEAIRAAARAHRTVEQVIQRSPFLDVGGDWPSYEATVNAKFRQGLRRKERRLRDEGDIQVESSDGSRDLDRILTEGFAVEGSQWKAAEGTAIASRPETDAFYRAVARWAADNGWLRLWTLKKDERAVAFRLDLEVAGVYYHVKGGYDAAYSQYSPGLLLQHMTVRHAFDRGLVRYEFLGADEGYKLKWTKTTRERVSVRVFDRGARGTLAWFGRAVARPAVRRVVQRSPASSSGAAG